MPVDVVARCYTDVSVFNSNLAYCEQDESDTDHGTRVAESVLDIAPGVSLYISNPSSRADLQATADWMASQGVTAINRSVSSYFNGPGDGTSPNSISPLRTVDQAAQNGIVRVNSSGNHAGGSWFGEYSDQDGDRFIEMVGTTGSSEINFHPIRADASYGIQLQWEDNWGRAGTNLDFELFDRITGTVVEYSYDPQSGENGQYPYEYIIYIASIDTDDFGISVYHRDGPVSEWVQVMVFGPGDLYQHTLLGSITSPGESANPGLLEVGAAHWFDTQTIAPYGSRGPTPDGRIKPDIVGGACGETTLRPLEFSDRYGGLCGFAGTSQAAPHVAGLAALVKQANPSFTPQQLADFLKHNAADRDVSGPDNNWGYGFAQLRTPPAAPGPEPDPGTDACGETITADGAVTGTWAAGCQSTVSGRGYAQYYSFTLAQQSTVTIELESSEADTYLYLRAGEARSGVFLDEDDDSPDTTRSEIVATLSAGTYTIEATTFAAGATGDFTLPVKGLRDSGTTPGLGSRDSDREVLIALFHATDGPNWTNSDNWLTDEPLGERRGVITDVHGRVISLEVFRSSLDDPIPAILGNLDRLERLSLSGNELSGTIPGDLGTLSELKELDLRDNHLRGEIPAELNTLRRLEVLNLGRNGLTGVVPTELGNLDGLKVLDQAENRLTGVLPSELGNIGSLSSVQLESNLLSGNIPLRWLNVEGLRLSLWG